MKNFSIIVAIAENNAIGKDNQLLWHLSEDLKRFKKLTTDHCIVMGKKTFLSLPKGPLPNRTNIVITDDATEKIDGCVMAYSIEDAISKSSNDFENFIIGGGSIYSQFLPLVNKLYLTIVHHPFDADTFFPEINFSEWTTVSSEKIDKNDVFPFDYTYLILKKY